VLNSFGAKDEDEVEKKGFEVYCGKEVVD